MTDKPKGFGWLFWPAALFTTVLVLLAMYVGTYLLVVKSTTYGFLVPGHGPPELATVAQYYWPGTESAQIEHADWLFDPLNKLDRVLRPKMWEPER